LTLGRQNYVKCYVTWNVTNDTVLNNVNFWPQKILQGCLETIYLQSVLKKI
jgi:hypothetical protein